MGKKIQFYKIDTLLKADVPRMIFFEMRGAGKRHAKKLMRKWKNG